MPNEPADPLLPSDPPEPPPVVIPGVTRPKNVVCDFCGCKLAMDGGVLQTGDRARRLAASEDSIDAKDAEITSLRSQLQTAREELSALKAAQAPAASARSRF